MQMEEGDDGNDELGMGAAEMMYMTAPKQMVIGGTIPVFGTFSYVNLRTSNL
jgi:hypothetical protein